MRSARSDQIILRLFQPHQADQMQASRRHAYCLLRLALWVHCAAGFATLQSLQLVFHQHEALLVIQRNLQASHRHAFAHCAWLSRHTALQGLLPYTLSSSVFRHHRASLVAQSNPQASCRHASELPCSARLALWVRSAAGCLPYTPLAEQASRILPRSMRIKWRSCCD